MSDSVFLTDGNGTITGLVVGDSYSGDLVIPEYIAEERITAIGDHAFENCESLTSVTIPNGVISIGNSAFSCCIELISATIPNSVTSIGADAFGDCNSLTSIIIPNGVTNIRENTFMGCGNLESITIPNSITTIGEDAFCVCMNLNTIYVDDPNNLSPAVSSYDWSNTGSNSVNFVQNPRCVDYLIKSGTLMDLGDNIRILSGVEDAMTATEMVSTLNTFNSGMTKELLNQDDLIAQIVEMLEGKTVPDVGGVETCTVTLQLAEGLGLCEVGIAYIDKDGNLQQRGSSTNGDIIEVEVVNPSIVYISTATTVSVEGSATELLNTTHSSAGGPVVLHIYGDVKAFC